MVAHPLIKPLIDEAEEALQRGEGSEFLGAYLDKIRDIKAGLTAKEESYEEFIKDYQTIYDFNMNAQKISKQEVLQLESQSNGLSNELFCRNQEALASGNPAGYLAASVALGGLRALAIHERLHCQEEAPRRGSCYP